VRTVGPVGQQVRSPDATSAQRRIVQVDDSDAEIAPFVGKIVQVDDFEPRRWGLGERTW
jgi:hypothetical protein